MDSLWKAQQRLIPDILSIMHKRYQILRTIRFMEPVGRRTLAKLLGLSERVLRSEVALLNEQQLIKITTIGMNVTEDGRTILQQLERMMREISGINNIETRLQQKLGLNEVIVIPGNSDKMPWVKAELGRVCVQQMQSLLEEDNIITVTGGTTMAAVAEMLTPSFSQNKNILFVPARGGIGEDVKNQANMICAKMAEKSGTSHRVLYVPDQVSREMYESFVKEPSIKEVLKLVQSANIVLHGIGDALTMAKRRKTDEENMEKIKANKAVGEAFGYYFDENGEVVHQVQTIGLQLKDLSHVNHVIAVAGGTSKAKAIQSYMKSAPPTTILITDEGVAKAILEA